MTDSSPFLPHSNWRRIPFATIVELGKITALSGQLEGTLLDVAEWLGRDIVGLENPRRETVSKVRNHLARPAAAAAFAERAQIEVGRWERWLFEVRDALDERNRMVHGRLIFVWTDGSRVQHARAGRTGLKSPRPVESLEDVRAVLENLVDRGDSMRLIAIARETLTEREFARASERESDEAPSPASN